MRVLPLLTATFALLAICGVQSLGLGTAGIGGAGAFLGYGVIKLIKLKLAALVVASLLKKFQGSKPSFGGGGDMYPPPPYYGGGGGSGGGGGGGVYPPPPTYGCCSGNGGGGGAYYRRKRSSVDPALNAGLKHMYDTLAINDESMCIPRVVCEVNIAQARKKFASPLENELLNLFRYYVPKFSSRTPSYNYAKAIKKAFQQKEVKECINVFTSCRIPSVNLLQLIGRLAQSERSSLPLSS